MRWPALVRTSSKFTEILAHNYQSFALNESNVIEFWGKYIVGEDVISPKTTNVRSLQEAIIQYMEYPFTIQPIIINEKPRETSKVLPKNQVSKSTAEVLNDQKNTDINFEDMRHKECEEPFEIFSSTVQMIILKEDLGEKTTGTSKFLPSNRALKTLFKGFNNPTNSDFKFKIKRQECDYPNESCPTDEENDGFLYIYCHKWFVEENCDYLKKVFTQLKSIKESNEMEIKGYSYETYFHFIQYLYTDSIETKDIKLLDELLLLSDMYSDEELKTRCVSLIKPLMNVENVCHIYSSAINIKSSDLEEYCFEFMSKNIKSIIETKGYEQMDPKIAKSFHKNTN